MDEQEVRANLKNAGIYMIGHLQNSPNNWMEFLGLASNHYSRDFMEQILIIAERPNSTAVMEKELWEKNNYNLNYGAEAISVFQNFNGVFLDEMSVQSAEIKEYYDISQVHRVAGLGISKWELGNINENIVINYLLKNYDNVDPTSFATAVITAVESQVSDSSKELRCFIVNSASYQILSRCRYNPKVFFRNSDFNLVTKFINDFDFIDAAYRASKQAGNILKNIARVVRKNYNNKTSKIIKEEQYNGHNISSRRRYEQGRTGNNIYGAQDRRGGNSSSGGRGDGRKAITSGQVRSNAPEISQRERPPKIHQAQTVQRYDGVPAQHRGTGADPQGGNNRTTEEGIGSNRGTERTRPNEMGGLDEQHNSVSGRNSAERNNLHLNSEQNNKSEIQAEVEENQASAFSISQEEIDAILQRGDNVENGKFRIYEQFSKDLPAKENIQFLKNEYGWGGAYPATKVNGVEIDEGHDSKGITISKGSITNPDAKILLKWKNVEKRIRQLISLDRYLNDKEKEYYPKWLEYQEQAKVERAKEVTPAEKKNVEYIYLYGVGDKVCLGADNYEISYVDKNTIKLHDINFPLLDKGMERSEFDNRIKESPFNEHLRLEKLIFDVNEFATAASDILEDNMTIRNVHKNSDYQSYIDEIKAGVNNYVTRLTTEEAAVDGFTSEEIVQFLNRFSSNQSVRDYVYTQISGTVDKSLTQLEMAQETAEKLNLPFSSEFSDSADDELDPYVYDGSMSFEDYTERQHFIAQEAKNSQTNNDNNVESPAIEQLSIEIGFTESSLLRDFMNANYPDNKIPFALGNALFKFLDKKQNIEREFEELNVGYYDKTDFNITAIINGEDYNYNGRFDIGDGKENGNGSLINHIESDLTYCLKNNPYNASEEDLAETRDYLDTAIPYFKEHSQLTADEQKLLDDFKTRNPIIIFDNEKSVNQKVDNKKASVAPTPRTATHTGALSSVEKSNYIIKDDSLGVGTKLERFTNNINAIKLLKNIESENRLAATDEQAVLAKYVGWGGLAEYFEKDNIHYGELKECLTDDELTSASESTLTAFYTPPIVIRSVYKVLGNLGFKSGNILEPSCGIGNFMGMLPDDMQKSKMFGIELDSISGRIAKQLYQKNNISIGGYENEKLPDSFFDVAVGNVPFGNFSVFDKRYKRQKFLIHDYFFAKTLDKVRPGGVIAFITAKGTMDKKDNRIRKYVAERATLLGAIRLPNDTFRGAAGTEVTSDIIFLQKKEALSLDNPDWLYLKENEDGVVVNQYFADNPDMVLGDMKLISGPYGQQTACISNENRTLEEKLNTAVSKIRGLITEYRPVDIDEAIEAGNITTIPADPTVKNYSYTLVAGDLYFRKNSIMEKQNISGLPAERIRVLIKVRELLNDLIEYQTEDYPETDIVAKRKELTEVYEQFTSKYGLISSKSNRLVFREDSSFPLLTSLEVIDEDGNLKRKSDIFFKRTIKPYIPVTHAETAIEALAVSMNERGKVDIEFISELTGFGQDKVISDLKGVIFAVPGKDEYQLADEYLSGNVRDKLFVAKNAAESDSKYADNVKPLDRVQPADLSAAEVNVRLGATWIDPKYIEDFIFDVFNPNQYVRDSIKVYYSKYTSKWSISGKGKDTGILSNNTYGTKEYNAYYLLEQALNLKSVKVYDSKTDAKGKTIKIFNPAKTALAQKKQEKIHQKFEEWIFSDPQRRNDLLRTYNDTFNNIRNRQYDGSHLIFPGMNPEITLLPHQVNAIARTLYGGNTLLAHVVGAGKTFEMIAGAMEAKRIGLCNKSLFVVPNHLTEQMGADFLRLYPAANILVATKNDFAATKRKEFCSRIATGDYDAVIIGHSQFEKIPVSTQRQQAFIQNEIDEILLSIDEVKFQNGENFTIKQLESERKKLEKKLKDLYENNNKDDVVTFEQLGIDRLFVDEAHKFKNLFIRTKMTRVAGITSSSANKSSDLLMKCRYIDEITGGRGIVFATGTPVSNSMSELYTIQRYLQFDTLKKLGFSNFDAWASTFGATVTASELAPEGKKYREKTRFSKFYNLPELMSIFKVCADIQTADMLNLPVPKANFTTVIAKPSDYQKNFVDKCGKRADLVRNGDVEPTVDNMLKITTDGRKLAVDQRIIDPTQPDFSGSKVNKCVDNVFDIWLETADKRSTQLIFCDLSTPSEGFNVYDDIREKLISKGVPNEEIAFIHNYNTDTQKAALFSSVRQGKIRILLGSTEKMGAGTNVQDKLIALHDLDCPWRPSDLEQRLGRIVRQGNENKEVNIFRYVTEDTFDAYSYQIIENKQKFISQIMSSKTPVREAEDVDQSALSYAEIKMLATGNPLIKEKMDLDIKITNLKVLKADYLSNRYKLEDNVISAPTQIAAKENIIEKLSTDITTAQTHQFKEGEFLIMLNGTAYTNKKEGGKHLLKIIENLPHRVETDKYPVGEYRGFSLSVGKHINVPMIYLQGELNYHTELSDDIYGNLTRMNNRINSIQQKKEDALSDLEEFKNEIKQADLESKKPFEQEQELQRISERLDEVNRMLNSKSEKEVEYKQVSNIELDTLRSSDIELDFVSNGDDFIVRYNKSDSDKVQTMIDTAITNIIKR